MFVWTNEAHKPLEIDEHNLTKLNQISTYWVYIFNTKKKKKQWSDLTSSLEWKFAQPPPFNFLYFRPFRWHIFSISRCMARWSTITRIAHFKSWSEWLHQHSINARVDLGHVIITFKVPTDVFLWGSYQANVWLTGCLPSPQYSVPTITADNSMCDALCLSHLILMRSHQNVY